MKFKLVESIINEELDSLGNELTDAQTHFFKNSKMRDSDGNLLVFYHGSPDSELTFFRCDDEYPESFFSQSYDYAYQYSEDRDEAGKYGKVYSVYLNITNPFDANNANCQELLKKIYNENGTPENVVISTDVIYRYLRTHHTEYDGIIAGEGLTDKMKSDFGDIADISYVPLYSNQVKATNNLNPTNSNDFRK